MQFKKNVTRQKRSIHRVFSRIEKIAWLPQKIWSISPVRGHNSKNVKVAFLKLPLNQRPLRTCNVLMANTQDCSSAVVFEKHGSNVRTNKILNFSLHVQMKKSAWSVVPVCSACTWRPNKAIFWYIWSANFRALLGKATIPKRFPHRCLKNLIHRLCGCIRYIISSDEQIRLVSPQFMVLSILYTSYMWTYIRTHVAC